ncbi:unnamed protein product [Brassica rapa subsp. trilocularis]
MAARSDEQMSFLLSTIDQIDEVKFLLILLNWFNIQLEHRTNCHVKRTRRLKILYVTSVPTFSLAEIKLSMTSKNIVSYVRELKPHKDTSRIEVRIVRLWRNYNKESENTIEMVFVDKEVSAYSISSRYNSTHILLDPTLEFTEEFKASLPNDSLAFTNNDSSQWSVGTATSIYARFFVLNERLTISNPNNCQWFVGTATSSRYHD